MAHRIDPHYCNNFIDAHVLDRTGTPEDELVEQILSLAMDGKFTLLLPYSVKAEIEHPNTPGEVKRRALELIYTEPVTLTAPELETHRKVRELLRGYAKPGKHDQDAFHIVESAKYGGGYFITNDQRILKKQPELTRLVGIAIVTPSEFLDLYQRYEHEEANLSRGSPP
jgi:hypothetical protein